MDPGKKLEADNNKIVTKIALCPKCKTRVPVNGRKGQSIKVTCSDCGGRGIVKI